MQPENNIYQIRHYTTDTDFTIIHCHQDRNQARERMGKLAMLENNAEYRLYQIDGEDEIRLQVISNEF